MRLKDIRARHVYAASAAAFVLLAGYEGARMAAGHDPALAASRSAPAPAVTPSERDDPGAQRGFADPGGTGAPDDQGGFADPGGTGAPDDQGGFAGPGSQVPQPESRLS